MYGAVMWQDLREQIDVLQEKVHKLKRAVKVYSKRLKANEGQWCLLCCLVIVPTVQCDQRVLQFPFTALTRLVWRQEEHPVCKKS